MSKINVLPKEVYQLIAAGEVVERPSSVIKEMIENSVDANAKNITVEIKNGGSTFIRITDDGNGIERDDVKNVFVSHATSKIKEQDDLNSIATLGFRGEAMASVGAVAKVELLTKGEGEEIGTRYVIEGSEEKEFYDAGCPFGTTIIVRDIFFNTPARMKFLKKDVTEGNSVAGVVDRMALSHPDISFRFIRDGKQTLITSGNGDLKGTIYSVFSKEITDSLIPVDYKMNSLSVTGFTSKPSESRKSRAMQYFFINGRIVMSKTVMAACEQAYKNSIMVGRFPACILNVELDTTLVDVNVHPAKTEVRFANEKPVFDVVYYGVKNAIENLDTVKTAHFTPKSVEPYNPYIKEEKPIQQTFMTGRIKPKEDFFSVSSPAVYKTENVNNEKQKSFINLNKIKEKTNLDITFEEENEVEVKIIDENEKTPEFKVIGEAFKTYIIVEIKNELYYIDKHAAHERMNFEKLKAQATVETQILLEPVAVKLTKEEFSSICENFDLIEKCGFTIEEFGDSTILVRAVPSLLDFNNIKDLIEEIAEKLISHKTDIEPEKIDWIYHSTSCRGAVKAGDKTPKEERELFVKKLLRMPDIRYCPHGRPVMIKISKYDIEKQFGRV